MAGSRSATGVTSKHTRVKNDWQAKKGKKNSRDDK